MCTGVLLFCARLAKMYIGTVFLCSNISVKVSIEVFGFFATKSKMLKWSMSFNAVSSCRVCGSVSLLLARLWAASVRLSSSVACCSIVCSSVVFTVFTFVRIRCVCNKLLCFPSSGCEFYGYGGFCGFVFGLYCYRFCGSARGCAGPAVFCG